MDVNGTKMHVLNRPEHWAALGVAPGESPLAWLETDGGVQLGALATEFRGAARTPPFSPDSRRGAGRDSFGWWYWIAQDGRTIMKSNGRSASTAMWPAGGVAAPAAECGGFSPVVPTPPEYDLCGLTVTTRRYLVAGVRSSPGLLVFDLWSSSPPTFIDAAVFAGIAFEPWDIAADPDGGVWVLDRAHRRLWRFDRWFRACGLTAAAASPPDDAGWCFKGLEEGGDPVSRLVDPLKLPPARDAEDEALSIEVDADGRVVVLDTPTAVGRAALVHEMLPPRVGATTWESRELEVDGRPVRGHDLAVTGTGETRTLWVVEADGNQVRPFKPGKQQGGPLRAGVEYFPLQSFSGRALIATERGVYFDLPDAAPPLDGPVKWMLLRRFDRPRYEREGDVVLGFGKSLDAGVHAFEGDGPLCTWHRIFIDATIPQGTGVEFMARACDDIGQLDRQEWVPQPACYLRSEAEIPFFDPFEEADETCKERGTWELLLQGVSGRFAQLKLRMFGNERRTPSIRAVRLTYPRPAAPLRFLPRVYREEPERSDLLQRFLSNMDGVLTDLEGKVRDGDLLYDARTTPGESLNWMASWIGLTLDPAWEFVGDLMDDGSLRRGGGRVGTDRRRLLIRLARRLYERRGTVRGLLLAVTLVIEPCLEEMLRLFQKAAREAAGPVHRRLEGLGLALPRAWWTPEDYEDLLYEYLVHPDRPGRIRIVEGFRTRHGRRLVEGDPTAQADDPAPNAGAHRFSVLVPQGISAAHKRLVERIVHLERPAHTAFDVRTYWDVFRVGSARLGLDTAFAPPGSGRTCASGFAPAMLGVTPIASGFTVEAPPKSVRDRVVLDRDPIGQWPEL